MFWQRWKWLAAVAGLGAAAAVSLVLILWPPTTHSGYVPPSLPTPSVSATVPAPTAAPSPVFAARTTPTRVIIPAISVNAPITPEGVDNTGALQVPPLTARNLVGWWKGGAAPGQKGPAVLAGHVDSAAAGPLVFWKLSQLKPGDQIVTQPGSITFQVTAVQSVSKNTFPTQQVYGVTADAELRLITCGGTFNSSTGHYEDNVIVYARMI